MFLEEKENTAEAKEASGKSGGKPQPRRTAQRRTAPKNANAAKGQEQHQENAGGQKAAAPQKSANTQKPKQVPAKSQKDGKALQSSPQRRQRRTAGASLRSFHWEALSRSA